MNKQAYEHTVGLVLSKQAGDDWLDRANNWLHNNKITRPFARFGSALGQVMSSAPTADTYNEGYLPESGTLRHVLDPNGDAGDAINKYVDMHPKYDIPLGGITRLTRLQERANLYSPDASMASPVTAFRRSGGQSQWTGSPATYIQSYNNSIQDHIGGKLRTLEDVRKDYNDSFHPALVEVKRRHPNWVK
jgi:hypothetical protein